MLELFRCYNVLESEAGSCPGVEMSALYVGQKRYKNS